MRVFGAVFTIRRQDELLEKNADDAEQGEAASQRVPVATCSMALTVAGISASRGQSVGIVWLR